VIGIGQPLIHDDDDDDGHMKLKRGESQIGPSWSVNNIPGKRRYYV
jgi:hypothetical protein